MKRAGCFVLFTMLIIGMTVASDSEVAKVINFHPLSNPQPWTLGDKPAYLVVTERNWPSHYSRQPKGANFTANIYIVASLGLKPNPGYTVRILQLQQQGEVINVTLELVEPDPNKFYIQVMVKPIEVAEVPKASLPPLKPLSFVFVDQQGKELADVQTVIF